MARQCKGHINNNHRSSAVTNPGLAFNSLKAIFVVGEFGEDFSPHVTSSFPSYNSGGICIGDIYAYMTIWLYNR